MARIDAIPMPSYNSREAMLRAIVLALVTVGGGVALWALYNEESPLLTDPARDTLNTYKLPLPPSEVICSDCGKLAVPVGSTGLCIDCYQKFDI